MDYTKPTLLVISGPNGAGKSTHIQTMLPSELNDIQSFDRDKARSGFEQELKDQGVLDNLIPKKSTEMMEDLLVKEMKKAIAGHAHFVLETPLSHADYWRYLDLFETNGYQIQLNYLCLDKVSDCIARVGQRVLEGGHYVAPDTIKSLYKKNLEFIDDYQSTFQIIELYDGMKVPTMLARLEGGEVAVASDQALKKTWLKTGLPKIAGKVAQHLANQKNVGKRKRNTQNSTTNNITK